jgi:DNA-binding MarR family transcriptional regulator
MDPVDLGRDLYDALERLVRFVRQLQGAGDLSGAAVSTLQRVLRDGPVPLGELARAERATQPNMTQLVTRLERSGLLERVADPADKRVTLVRVTAEGRAAVRRRREARAAALAPLLGRLDEADRAALAAALPVIHRLTSLNPESHA